MANTTQEIKNLRRHLTDSQQAFSNRLGVSVRAVANYEAGRTPNAAVLFKLASLAHQCGHESETVFSSKFKTLVKLVRV